MEIRAYAEEYVEDAQKNLGDAFDYAVMTLGMEPSDFAGIFAVSDVSRQFADGNPRYVAGMNGCELTREVFIESGLDIPEAADVMYVDKGPEYWTGWALAFYQWYSGYSFAEILNALPIETLISMYPVYHEMDITHFVERMADEMKNAYMQTRLAIRRRTCGLSQAELAEESGVPLRQIQLFEQRRRDINKTAGETLLMLSKSLHCRMEDLIELQSNSLQKERTAQYLK